MLKTDEVYEYGVIEVKSWAMNYKTRSYGTYEISSQQKEGAGRVNTDISICNSQ